MEFNRNFGKIESSNVMRFAPAGIAEDKLISDGWLPIVDNSSEFQSDSEYVYIATGWEEISGHIQKKFQKKKRSEYMRRYSRKKIISQFGETYQPFVQNLDQNSPELLSAFNQNAVYVESCTALHKCMEIYGQMYGLTDEQVKEQILVPAIVAERR